MLVAAARPTRAAGTRWRHPWAPPAPAPIRCVWTCLWVVAALISTFGLSSSFSTLFLTFFLHPTIFRSFSSSSLFYNTYTPLGILETLRALSPLLHCPLFPVNLSGLSTPSSARHPLFPTAHALLRKETNFCVLPPNSLRTAVLPTSSRSLSPSSIESIPPVPLLPSTRKRLSRGKQIQPVLHISIVPRGPEPHIQLVSLNF